jgi:hypothetical protein
MSVAYSMMVWLIAPGKQAHQEEELAQSADRTKNPWRRFGRE